MMPEQLSLIESIASLPPEQRAAIVASLTPQQAEDVLYHWGCNGRPNQLPPAGNWRTWLLLAGRGFGKTRTGAETVRARINSGFSRIALVGPTAADVRDVMIEGESGLLSIGPPNERPKYEPSKRRVTWRNGAIATAYSADEPERLRGPQHDFAWADEIASWRYPEAWDMLMFGLRLGDDPRVLVTTTPKPIKIIRELIADPTTAITRGSTYDNRANLAAAFLQQIVKKYEGTRLGRQELNAEILDDVPGALWSRALIEESRWPLHKAVPDLIRIVVAIDPAASAGEESDETGIIVAGKDAEGHGYILADQSGRYMPTDWAKTAVDLYRKHKADRIVAEVNNGGDMVEATVRMIDINASYTAVRASRGKVIRAEPAAALYEQKRIHHIGAFPTLEDQMCAFASDFDRVSAGFSPDRVDALVWALTDLLVEPMSGFGFYELMRQRATEVAERNKPQPDDKPNYAIGSVEYARALMAGKPKD